MFGVSSSKSKSSSSSKGNRRRNKQGRDDRRHNDKGSDEQGWSEWKYDTHYKRDWRERIGPDGKQEVQWDESQENVETEEIEEHEENAEADSNKNIIVPRRLNAIQIPKQKQGDDEIESNEYKLEGEPNTEVMPSQDPWASYQGQSVSSQNTTSDFRATRHLWNPQPGSQGAQWQVSSGQQLNPPMWNTQSNFQAPSAGPGWGGPQSQTRHPRNPGLYNTHSIAHSGYRHAENIYSQQQNQGLAVGGSSAVYKVNSYSPASTNDSSYPRDGSGISGTRQIEKVGYHLKDEDENDFHDQAGDESGTVQYSYSPTDKRSYGMDRQLSHKLETATESMAGLAVTEEHLPELEREDSTEEQGASNDPSQILPGTLGVAGQPVSIDTSTSLQRQQYKQNQSHRMGYNRQPPTLNNSFQIRDSKLFKKGKVFKCLWSEPIGEVRKKYQSIGQSLPSIEEEFLTNAKYGETAYHGIRRFIIVKERKGFSLCVPILTYGYQGTTKPGVKAEYHAMIHTGREAPSPLPGEKLVQRAVRIELSSPIEKIDVESRVNYAKVYTIEHNIKVCFIGKIHADSRATFETDFKKIDTQDENES